MKSIKKSWLDPVKLVAPLAVPIVLYAVIASIVLQNRVLTADAQISNRPKPAASVTKKSTYHADKPWTYDFTKLPNGALPRKDWNFETGSLTASYNKEAQTYTSRRENVRIENGALVIEAKHQYQNGKQFTSARINTKDKFSFTNGKLEVAMMLPKGSGTWPAAWLLPQNSIYKSSDYGISKADKFGWALNGEVDFAESIGSLPGQNIPAAHSYREVQSMPTYTPAYVDAPYTEYHSYGVIKTPDTITFTLDGQPYASRHKSSASPLDWPYDQPYYLIINLAVGGNWAGANGIDASSAPWQLKIKSISYTPL